MKWLFSLFNRTHNENNEAYLARYKRLRELGRKVNLSLIKQLPESALPECAKKLGLSKAGTLVLNQDDEIAVAYDYCLHHHRRVGRNIIERTQENAPPVEDPDEQAYLQALSSARFSLFRVEEILPHRGARLLDLLTHSTVDIVDMSLSSTGVPGVIVAGRLLTFEDFTLSSGTLIPIPEVVFEVRIQPIIHKFLPEIPAEKAELSPARGAAFEAQVLRIALHAEEDVSFYTDMAV